MKVLAFAASNSRASINKQLVGHAINVLTHEIEPNADCELIDLNDYEMAIYSIDRQTEGGIPQLAHDFYAKIGGADALIISFAEYNGSFTSAYKNIYDWASRIDMKVFQGKPILMMAASPGGRGGASVLKSAMDTAPYFGGDVVASVSVAKFPEVFDHETGALTNEDLSAQLRAGLTALKQAVSA